MISATGTKRTDSGGFTLLELILVLVLALILLGLSLPRLARFSRENVVLFNAEQTLSLLRAGREHAARDGIPYRMEIDTKEQTVQLKRRNLGVFDDIPDSIGLLRTLPTGVVVEFERFDGSQGSGNEIELKPTGECTPARITFRDRHGHELYLVCKTPLDFFEITSDKEQATP